MEDYNILIPMMIHTRAANRVSQLKNFLFNTKLTIYREWLLQGIIELFMFFLDNESKIKLRDHQEI